MGGIEGQEPATPELPDELVIIPRKPLKLGEVSYDEVRLREPTADEWTKWSSLAGVEGDIKAVSVVSGIPEKAIRQLGARDLVTGARYIAAFLS